MTEKSLTIIRDVQATVFCNRFEQHECCLAIMGEFARLLPSVVVAGPRLLEAL